MTTPRPVFVDTNAFIAIFDEDDSHHEAANAVLDGIESGDLAYGPIFTSRYVLSETATTLLYAAGHRAAVRALRVIRNSATFNMLDVTPSIFADAVGQFRSFDDQQISMVDHLDSILCAEYDIDHIFAFEEDFRPLGLNRVPVDTADLF